MTWYSLSLAGDIEKVNQAAWQSAWEVSQAKTRIDYGSAIFKKIGVKDGLTLYFTPSAQPWPKRSAQSRAANHRRGA